MQLVRKDMNVNDVCLFVMMVFNATFNTISAISGLELTISVVICTDCIGSCKSNYHTITTTMALKVNENGRLSIIARKHKL